MIGKCFHCQGNHETPDHPKTPKLSDWGIHNQDRTEVTQAFRIAPLTPIGPSLSLVELRGRHTMKRRALNALEIEIQKTREIIFPGSKTSERLEGKLTALCAFKAILAGLE
jgi:hypothetical protein